MKQSKRVLSEENMLKGYNCAQSVMLAFAREIGLTETVAAKLVSGFGGGMGGLREVCGAVSGMAAVVSMLTGYTEPDDRDGKIREYHDIRALANAFKEKNDTIICRELLKGEAARVERDPYPRTPEYYTSRPCTKLVGDAAELLEAYCVENNIPLV